MLIAYLESSTQSHGPRSRSRHPRHAPRARRGEQARLQAHFREVLLELRSRDVTHLDASQRAARERLIEELARYARAGRFPRNYVSRERIPIFIDPHGTRCAMAQLIESTGHTALVAEVAARRNFALIRELASNAALLAWLDEFGLTAAEAGRIQPSYCFVTKAQDCFCNQSIDSNNQAVLEGVVVEGTTGGALAVRVDAVHGTTEWKAGDTVTPDAVRHGEALSLGDSVLVAQTGDYLSASVLESDQTLEVSCSSEVPALSKETAIAGLLAADSEKCAAELEKESSVWGESICDDEGCGCVAHDSGSGGPLLVSTALLWALARRRRRR
ncbi:MYXO-CTERM sorting domain-containing protein [Nannocystis sp. SCPEA4]|uniref:MYXO-CTERM sorting domain-containing protein n=1 Tax=Nannocystis sp. SCPEA4 TaxID=2996787 RepID=UPI0022714BC4|nr:MYXO-CTERM sorting domain-containing protein [Nannocystis sp. SCPEA4]MCY1061589.1 MYXO-CTERM sorting domain-containing protein [Nannocystis sp. SCPEA4]